MNTNSRRHGYGYIPDLGDHRDYTFSLPVLRQPLPTKADLRPSMPPVYDQGALGSCTANAIGAALEYEAVRQGEPLVMPSRLFIYYNERAMEHTIDSDAGAMIRDGVKSVANLGVCPEDQWPYDLAKFRDKPSPACYVNAMQHQVLQYARVTRSLASFRSTLAAGFPIIFGFTVYESFESDAVATTGSVPLPTPNEGVLGGHAVLCVGYDDSAHQFLVRNSWGDGWGIGGYCKFPYAYFLDSQLSSDFWVVRKVE